MVFIRVVKKQFLVTYLVLHIFTIEQVLCTAFADQKMLFSNPTYKSLTKFIL